ncbi:RNA polymerase sigma factor [Paenibacillus larvae]|uniref:RNA polymerase sigma factor SigW n=1 Tax=Paenibacillus larvae subsp. larvae TaxID=147375 RepID=A0A6C0QKL4_9BACL|nr:sigma-70 family RNA polymerase sigma factor [Paenibacillus larvae]QHZ49259.1 RNA polymerase sigma factor SigW [Paenibacillus larvae subsp. larvae]
MKRILIGDEAAFRQLMSLYRTYIYQVIYSVLRHPKDAEDITQETFVTIYFSLPHYQGKGLKAWMTRIATNKAIDYKRRAFKKREESTDEMEAVASTFSVHVAASTDIEETLIRKERKELVVQMMTQLPPNYRKTVELYYFYDKTYQDIAQEEGISVKTVESRLYRAKQWVRANWKEEDFK